MHKLARQLKTVACLACLAACTARGDSSLQLPPDSTTHDDLRAYPIQEIYVAYVGPGPLACSVDPLAQGRAQRLWQAHA